MQSNDAKKAEHSENYDTEKSNNALVFGSGKNTISRISRKFASNNKGPMHYNGVNCLVGTPLPLQMR